MADVAAVVANSTFVIVGAGAAGLQWGHHLHSAGLSYVILEKAEGAGAFFTTFPRSRKLISANRRYVGPQASAEFKLRHDWHSILGTDEKFVHSANWFPHADSLVEYLRKVAAPLKVQYNTTVTSATLEPGSGKHMVRTASGANWLADHLILATGYQMKEPPRCLAKVAKSVFTYGNFPSLDPTTLDAEWCRDRRVAIFGSGNAAFETADMMQTCAGESVMFYKNPPRFSALTHYVGDVRLTNAGHLDRYQLKSLDSTVQMSMEDMMGFDEDDTPDETRGGALARLESRLEGGEDEDGTQMKMMKEQMKTRIAEDPQLRQKGECKFYESVGREFSAGGHQPVILFAGGFTTRIPGLIETSTTESASREHRKFPRTSAWWEDRKQTRRWYAGAVMHSQDFRVSAGGFIHGFRYLVRSQFNHVMSAHFGTPWPRAEFGTFREACSRALDRIQNSSGLYQMQDMLVDVMVLHEDGAVAYYEELPREWWYKELHQASRAITIDFKYSNKEVWDWDLLFDKSHIGRYPSLFLHPVFTAWVNGKQVGNASHAMEDITTKWVDEDHVREIIFALHMAQTRILLAGARPPPSRNALEEAALARMKRQWDKPRARAQKRQQQEKRELSASGNGERASGRKTESFAGGAKAGLMKDDQRPVADGQAHEEGTGRNGAVEASQSEEKPGAKEQARHAKQAFEKNSVVRDAESKPKEMPAAAAKKDSFLSVMRTLSASMDTMSRMKGEL